MPEALSGTPVLLCRVQVEIPADSANGREEKIPFPGNLPFVADSMCYLLHASPRECQGRCQPAWACMYSVWLWYSRSAADLGKQELF